MREREAPGAASPTRRGKRRTSLKLERHQATGIGLLVIHIVALAAFVPMFFSWSAVFVAVALYCVTGLSITLCYHRCLTHRGLRLPNPLEYLRHHRRAGTRRRPDRMGLDAPQASRVLRRRATIRTAWPEASCGRTAPGSSGATPRCARPKRCGTTRRSSSTFTFYRWVDRNTLLAAAGTREHVSLRWAAGRG